jgi:uncharacterized phage infection (PIP) family protein YhgE
MASPLGRRRASSAATRSGSTQFQSKHTAKPKSVHTSDEFLHDFLNPSFDPVKYLNANLPPLAPKSGFSQQSGAVPLADLSKETNGLLSQLNAQTTRLSTTLTQLTDDILRSGSRLAYEVELLRGETLSLSEALNETLLEDIKTFVPGGLDATAGEKRRPSTTENDSGATQPSETNVPVPGGDKAINSEPLYIQQLRTLTLVRSRIETVVKTFGDAMDFPFPPSELSVGSSFLSVSAPEPGSDQQSSEEKGQQTLKKLREDIAEMLRRRDDPVAGIEQAANRIENLKELTKIWKGTSEEKGRNKFIESLAKMVEDRHRELVKEREAGKPDGSRRTETTAASEEAKPPPPGGFGLISQLQKLRSGL